MSVLGSILESATKHNSNTTAGTTTELHKNFMMGVAEYIEKHVKFNGTFTGVNSSGSALTTGITSKVNPVNLGSVVVTGAGGFVPWINSVYSAIRTIPILVPAQFIPNGNIPVFPTIIISWTQEQLKGIAGDNGESAHGKCMDKIGQWIIIDMKAGFIKSIPGSVGAYVGALTVNSITCD